jgi:hypothetical protein
MSIEDLIYSFTIQSSPLALSFFKFLTQETISSLVISPFISLFRLFIRLLSISGRLISKIEKTLQNRPVDRNQGRYEEYKKQIDANIEMHRKEMSRKISNLRSSNSKQYWNSFRQVTNKKQQNISIDSIFEFFRNINKAPETNNEDEINLPDIDNNLINNLNNIKHVYIDR